MTKEEFIHRIKTEEATLTISQIDDFFESNICIHKGDNRHPHADVLHKWIEGAKIRAYDFDMVSCIDMFTSEEYHIKNKEVHEWQYLITATFNDYANKLSEFITDDEFKTMFRSRSEAWVKIEETKRLRK